MKKLWFILGLIMAAIAILGSLYLSIWLCLVGGIVQIVEACKATPVSSMGIALGILRFVCTSLVGWGCFFVCGGVCAIFFGKSVK